MVEERLLTVKDVAALLQVEEHTVYRLCNQKALKHIKISYKVIRFCRADVDAWLASCRVGDDPIPELRHVKPQPRQLELIERVRGVRNG